MDLLKSASKLVFLIMTVAAVGLTAAGVLTGENFMVLATAAFSFYFSHKGDAEQPYNGK